MAQALEIQSTQARGGALPTEKVTRAGICLTIRVASSADVPAIADIYRHITAQDMRFRFKQPIDHLDAEELNALVDPHAGMTTYLAVAGKLAVACATLICDPGREVAEVILSVRPEWKGRGVSWTLLEEVLACAAKSGLKRISSTEPGEDQAAINLQREMGFVARLRCADPVEFLMVKALDQ